MSKFIERLQQVSRSQPQSMGFKTAKAEQSRPKIQLVVDVTGIKGKPPIKELIAADALLLPAPGAGTDKTIWGTRLSKGTLGEVEQSIKTGADFVILPVDGDVLPPEIKIGKILQVEACIADIMLRTISELPVDAVLLTEDKETKTGLTWKRLMLIQRFSSLVNKPLLIAVFPDVTDNELQLIWEAGVKGVIVSVEAEQVETVTQKLRQTIDKLSFPSRRKHEKTVAILPRLQSQPEEPEEDEEDE